MRRRTRTSLVAAVLAGALVAALTTSPVASSAPSEPVHGDRAFTVNAEAYPMEPSPGTQDTELNVRPASTRAVATNPPAAAFARAAATDLGLAEAYVGQQGPAVAADTSTQNDPEDAVYDEGTTHLEVHVRDDPKSLAIAIGNGDGSDGAPSGSFSSRSESIAGGPVLVATAEAEANDVAVGPLLIGSGRFEAEARVDGTPGGASGSGTVTMSDATFNGVPIVVDNEGFRVDESKVPDPLVGEATAAIQEYFSPGGYADIRVVQPKVEIAEDGSSVLVSGGGVHIFFTNNDPAERYFAGFTMLGGEALAAMGGRLAQPTPSFTVETSAPPSATVPPAEVGGFRPGTPGTSSGGAVAPPSGGETVIPAELAYADGREVLRLRTIWPGIWWIIVITLLAWLTAVVFHTPWLAGPRRALTDQVDDFADRYTRG